MTFTCLVFNEMSIQIFIYLFTDAQAQPIYVDVEIAITNWFQATFISK